MIPRSACLTLFLFVFLSGTLLHADEEPEKPDPDRFGQPLIRAWIPSTLIADQREFLIQIQKEKTEESSVNEESNSRQIVISQGAGRFAQLNENTPLRGEISGQRKGEPTREGILVYYDPTVDRPEERDGLWVRHQFPGYPWLKPVRFLRVGSREEFEREVLRRTVIDGKVGLEKLEEQDGGFVFKDFGSLLISPTTTDNFSRWMNRTSLYWTYRDGYMFFGDFEEILTMEFPSPRDLEPKGTDADRDVFVQVDLNAVLPRQKRILWDIVRKELERSLQQYDDEGDAEYAFRKSVGDLQLNLIQAVTNDLESIKLGIDFASEDKPATAELEFVARPRVNLERYFGSSAIGTPALSAFVEEPAALTLATSWGLPERVVETLEKFLQVVDAQLDQQQGWTLDAILASQELTVDLLETVRGNNQLAVKLTQTEHGFTLYGGIRIRNPERFSKNLAIVLNGLTDHDGWGVQQSRDKTGRTYCSYRPADLTQSVTNHRRKRFPAELHFIVVDEILWFSAGRQDSLDVIAQSLDRIEEQTDQPVRSSIPLALIDVSLDKMFPDQDLNETEGFDRVPLAMVEKLDSLIPRRGDSPYHNYLSATEYAVAALAADDFGNLALAGETPTTSKPVNAEITLGAGRQENSRAIRLRALTGGNIKTISATADFANTYTIRIKPVAPDPMQLQKFLQADESRIRMQFDADEKRVTARASIGLGVIKHIYARMMESGLTDIERYFFSLNAAEASKHIGVDVKIYAPADVDATD